VPSRAGTSLGLLAWAAVLACGPRPGAEIASDLQPASLGVPATAALVVGCWSLDWALGSEETGGSVPDSVRFRDEVVFGTRERLVTPATHPSGRSASGASVPPWESRFVLNRWWIEDDALRIRFSDGEGQEWLAALSVDREDLAGAARYEASRPGPAGPVVADVRGRRITCAY